MFIPFRFVLLAAILVYPCIGRAEPELLRQTLSINPHIELFPRLVSTDTEKARAINAMLVQWDLMALKEYKRCRLIGIRTNGLISFERSARLFWQENTLHWITQTKSVCAYLTSSWQSSGEFSILPEITNTH